jgi:lipoprotein-releasing system permease protein
VTPEGIGSRLVRLLQALAAEWRGTDPTIRWVTISLACVLGLEVAVAALRWRRGEARRARLQLFAVGGALVLGAGAWAWLGVRGLALPAGVLLLYVVVARLALSFAGRGRRALAGDHGVRAAGWWIGSAVCLALAVHGTMSTVGGRETPGGFVVGLEAVRGLTLLFGLVVLGYTLFALFPVAFDALEAQGFAAFLSVRMLRATKSGFLTVISVLSILGVAVSSCALCMVTSIMGGFGHDLKRKILGNTAHIIVDVTHPRGFGDWQPALERVRAALAPLGGAATPVVGGDAMASSVTNTAGVLLRGVDLGSIGSVIQLPNIIEAGRFDYLVEPERLVNLPADAIIGRGPGGEPYLRGPGFQPPGDIDQELRDVFAPSRTVYPGIVLGRELAKSLHVLVGDEVTLLSPLGELGPAGIMPRARKFRVAGIFYSGMYEYDASHAYAELAVAQKFFDMEGRISRIDARVPDAERVDELRPAVDAAVANAVAKAVAKESGALRVRDWKEMNKNLFSALKLEKIATFIILSIAIAVASFCIICTLLLMVTEKASEIAVIKALGATDTSVLGVFMLEGMLIGAVGTVLGVSIALALALGLSWTGVRLDPEVYYIDRLPVNIDAGDYALVGIAALVICTIATIYPAVNAAQVRPVDGLRYE